MIPRVPWFVIGFGVIFVVGWFLVGHDRFGYFMGVAATSLVFLVDELNGGPE